MASPLICIDFGNSFTKVSIRCDENSPAALFEDDENRRHSEVSFCFPSLIQSKQPNAKYTENWKPLLFSDQSASRREVGGLEGLLASPAFRSLASEYGVASEELTHLLQLYNSARVLSGLKSPPISSVTPAASPPNDLIEHAVTFFKELRDKVRHLAERTFPGVDIDRSPTRLCVPAFADGKEGIPTHVEERFRSILQQAGWPLDQDSFLISEPVANIVGVLTRGANNTWLPYAKWGDTRRFIHMGRMFEFNSLVRAMRRMRPSYTVLSCDIGSYTTDVAIIRFYTNDDPDRRPDIWASSAALGIAQLDTDLFGVLPEEKISQLVACPKPVRLQWRKRLYGELFPYYLAALDEEVGAGNEMNQIREVVEGFASRIARVVNDLLNTIGQGDCQDVILTGGGCEIPKLRNGVLTSVAKHYGAGYLVHGPEGTPVRSSKTILSPRIVRGATALGGASVFFDRSFREGNQ